MTEVLPGTRRFESVLRLSDTVLEQRRFLVAAIESATESHVLGAFDGASCIGFLRYFVQTIGAAEGRPPVVRGGSPLTEGFVEAFGVDPAARRRRVGSRLQAAAQERCREIGCHQMRSRSPVTSVENYALKLEAGYVLHPSEQNDSYYFLLKL